MLRLPRAVENGSFQVWNMVFWSFYRVHDGFEILLHNKGWTARDTTDKFSFNIVGGRLAEPDFRKLYHISQL